EFIAGESFYLLFYFYKNGAAERFSQKNLMQQPSGGSIIAAVTSDFHRGHVALQFEELFRSIQFRGLVMVEIRGQGDRYYMIEANPRFWGPSQLFVDAGVNLFEAFMFDYGLLNSK